jgi:predicted metal-dependent hydrolase
MTSFRKWLLILLLFFPVAGNEFILNSQSFNYEEIFGENWKKAEAFEKENRKWMKQMSEKNRISYPVTASVVFPELVRYSSIRDKIEITLLKALYINSGDNYADFSIGVFQVKPSFAELVATEAVNYLGKKASPRLVYSSDYKDIKEYRKALVAKLEDPQSEFNFIIAFIRICLKKYNLNDQDGPELVRFLATAYNCGPDKTEEQIRSIMDKKYFRTGLLKSEVYSYAEVSLSWYGKFPEHYNR